MGDRQSVHPLSAKDSLWNIRIQGKKSFSKAVKIAKAFLLHPLSAISFILDANCCSMESKGKIWSGSSGFTFELHWNSSKDDTSFGFQRNWNNITKIISHLCANCGFWYLFFASLNATAHAYKQTIWVAFRFASVDVCKKSVIHVIFHHANAALCLHVIITYIIMNARMKHVVLCSFCLLIDQLIMQLRMQRFFPNVRNWFVFLLCFPFRKNSNGNIKLTGLQR